MLVISDTGPLRYLIELGIIDVLPELYGSASLWTTPAVIHEMSLPHFPGSVQTWAKSPPSWLQIEPPQVLRFLDQLHDGEASAISLAAERAAVLVLIDERDGTAVARDLGIATYGTLGVLALAGAKGKINFNRTVERLTSTTLFRSTPQVIERAQMRFEELLRDFGT